MERQGEVGETLEHVPFARHQARFMLTYVRERPKCRRSLSSAAMRLCYRRAAYLRNLMQPDLCSHFTAAKNMLRKHSTKRGRTIFGELR
jgi:hypothetical protein